MFKQRKQEAELEEARFERSFFLAQPEMFNEYMKQKDQEEEEGVSWAAPESVEEAQRLLGDIHDFQALLEQDDSTLEEDREFVKSLGFMDLLGGIDLDEMSDDDG